MKIVGLSGFARAGKDEAAKVLVEEFGFTQVAFADKLRDFLYALNPLVEYDGVLDRHAMKSHYVQEVIDEYGWQGYKETGFSTGVRRLLQRLGTEAGRQTLWDTIWIDAAFAGLPADAKVVVSDARFYNEFDAIRARGGEVWRIEREGVGPANEHASEMEAISYPYFARTIHNNGSLDEYRAFIRRAFADFETDNAPVASPSGNGLGPRKGDGSITSVNVPKRKGRM